jgi:DNA polymerase III subunit chi
LRVDFYHLTQSRVEAVLPQIAEKLLGSGMRLLVVSEDPDQIDRLDEALWHYRPESFLPHGRNTGNHVEMQPLLLSNLVQPANGAQHILLADGRWRDDALDFERAFYLFASDTIEAARTAWRNLGEEDTVTRHFWKQDDAGKWREGP